VTGNQSRQVISLGLSRHPDPSARLYARDRQPPPGSGDNAAPPEAGGPGLDADLPLRGCMTAWSYAGPSSAR